MDLYFDLILIPTSKIMTLNYQLLTALQGLFSRA